MITITERLQAISYISLETIMIFILCITTLSVIATYAIIAFKNKKNNVNSEGAHYNSNKWSTNPKLYNEIELSLEKQKYVSSTNETYIKKHNLDTYKIKIKCPLCGNVITKKKNPISNNYVYSCNNTEDCYYTTLGINKIFPFEILNMEEAKNNYQY